MSTLIKDGTGRGYVAKVDSNNRIQTFGTSHSIGHFSSEYGNYYSVHTANDHDTLSVTTNGGHILFLENNSSNNLLLSRIIGTVTGAVQFKIYRNSTVGTIGNNTEFTPINNNFNSAKLADATCYVWDEVGDGITGLSDGLVLAPLFVPGATVIDIEFNDTWILGISDNVSIWAKGIGASYEVSLYLSFFYHSME